MYNFDIEKNIIGGLLNDNSKLDDVRDIITNDDFGNKLYKELYIQIQQAVMSGNVCNIKTLCAEPRYRSQARDIAQLTTDGESLNTKHFAEKLKDMTIRREMLELAEHIKKTASSDTGDIGKVIEDIESVMSRVLVSRGGVTPKLAKEFITVACQELQLEIQKKFKIGLTTGYRNVDSLTGGFKKQELIIIGARTSIGKTAFALNIAENMAKRKTKIGFFSIEMDGASLVKRILTGGAEITRHDVLNGNGEVTEEQLSRIRKQAEFIYEYPLYIYDNNKTSLADIKTKSRALKRTTGMQILFIDYLGAVQIPGNRTRWEEIGMISTELKSLARELDIPVVVLTQVGRQSENKAPSLADIRDSGSIEQDADIVIILHRERGQEDSEVCIAKNRNGATGLVNMKFDGDKKRFEEV